MIVHHDLQIAAAGTLPPSNMSDNMMMTPLDQVLSLKISIRLLLLASTNDRRNCVTLSNKNTEMKCRNISMIDKNCSESTPAFVDTEK